MVDRILKEQDIKLILKASIDYNSYVLGILAQVVDSSKSKYGANPKRVFKELERGQKRHNQVVKDVMEKYDYNSSTN